MRTLLVAAFMCFLSMPAKADIVEPVAEPALESFATIEWVGEPAVEVVAEPVIEAVPEPIVEQIVEPAVEQIVEEAPLETIEEPAAPASAPAAPEPIVEADSAVVPYKAPTPLTPEQEQALKDEVNREFEAVYKMPVWINKVESVCPWKSSTAEGYIRAVRIEQNGRNQLFFQWIKKGKGVGDDASDSVLSTRIVEELEQKYQVVFAMPTMTLNPRSCELTTTADSVIDKQRFRFKILLREPGNYQLQVSRILGTAEI